MTTPVTQMWYAADAAACGEISALRTCWDKVSSLGPSFGYFPNAARDKESGATMPKPVGGQKVSIVVYQGSQDQSRLV